MSNITIYIYLILQWDIVCVCVFLRLHPSTLDKGCGYLFIYCNFFIANKKCLVSLAILNFFLAIIASWLVIR